MKPNSTLHAQYTQECHPKDCSYPWPPYQTWLESRVLAQRKQTMSPAHRKRQLEKAIKWIEARTDRRSVFPVAVKRRGYAEFVAYVYRAEISGKRVWYCVDLLTNQEGISRIKRICV